MKVEYYTSDGPALLALGKQLGIACLSLQIQSQGCVIFLQGPLGAGKTTLARGWLQGMGHTGQVKSPTYSIIEPYEMAQGSVFHFDCYRLQEISQLEEIGARDCFIKGTVCLIEWPELISQGLPNPDLSCKIEFHSLGRKVEVLAHSVVGINILRSVEK